MGDGEGALIDAPVDDAAPLTPQTLAQLVLAHDAAELADLAHDFVRVYDYRLSADLVEDAQRLVARARGVLEAAVVAVRSAGESWEEIGEALQIKRQSAHTRYAALETRFQAMLDEPTALAADGRVYDRRHPALHDPEQAATRLDDWSVTHRPDPPHSYPPPERPVTGGLRRMSPMAELAFLERRISDVAHRAVMAPFDADLPPDADELDDTAALLDRQAHIYSHLAEVVAPTQKASTRAALAEYATSAAKARALADQYRRDAATLRAGSSASSAAQRSMHPVRETPPGAATPVDTSKEPTP